MNKSTAPCKVMSLILAATKTPDDGPAERIAFAVNWRIAQAKVEAAGKKPRLGESQQEATCRIWAERAAEARRLVVGEREESRRSA